MISKDLLNCSKPLVLMFLFTTCHAKVLTLDEASEFQMKWMRKGRLEIKGFERAEKKDFTQNKYASKKAST